MKQFVILSLIVSSVSLYAQRPVVLSEDAQTIGTGRVESGIGIEYLAKHQPPAADLPTSELRLLVTSTHIGVAENVDFNLDWRGRLLAQYSSGGKGFDWGDLTVATKINLLHERDAFPSLGIRSAVKLPNTSYLPFKLGSDQTDYYFQMLATKHFETVEARVNLGLGILGNPQESGSQDDIYMYSGGVLFPFGDIARAFVELNGFVGHLGSDDKLTARLGVTNRLGEIDWNLFGSLRVTGDNRDFGTAFESSENWSVGMFLSKALQL